jgi:hypothetical protein
MASGPQHRYRNQTGQELIPGTPEYEAYDMTQTVVDTIHNPVALGGTEDSEGLEAGKVIIADRAITTTKHNRYITGVTATWPGDDTFSMTFTEAEAVTRYRVHVEGAAADTYVKVVEDAVNEAQAEAWLTTATSSASADVEYDIVRNSSPVAATEMGEMWSEWKEFPEGEYLSRLDFLGSAAGPFSIWVEAE